jgi:NADPH-dependent 7-cyano-7-deazaguanine reductase QueF-like protein
MFQQVYMNSFTETTTNTSQIVQVVLKVDLLHAISKMRITFNGYVNAGFLGVHKYGC